MAFSNYLEKKLLEHAFRNVVYTPPTTVYVALFNTLPAGDGTGGTEVSGGAYARQAITLGAATGGSPTSTTNSALIQYPTATASWGTINGAGMEQLTEGLARLGISQIPSYGNFVSFRVGPAAAIYHSLLRQGVIVRPLANYGMPEHLRVSIGLESENAVFFRALEPSL